mgnify:CR=1 FL=1
MDAHAAGPAVKVDPSIDAAPGKPVMVGDDGSDIPLKRVSKDAGINLHWSADNKKLHYTLGDLVTVVFDGTSYTQKVAGLTVSWKASTSETPQELIVPEMVNVS